MQNVFTFNNELDGIPYSFNSFAKYSLCTTRIDVNLNTFQACKLCAAVNRKRMENK